MKTIFDVIRQLISGPFRHESDQRLAHDIVSAHVQGVPLEQYQAQQAGAAADSDPAVREAQTRAALDAARAAQEMAEKASAEAHAILERIKAQNPGPVPEDAEPAPEDSLDPHPTDQ